MSNKKLFSHGNVDTASDIIQKKKGFEILKINKNNNISSINQFPSYENFILLMKSFFLTSVSQQYNLQVPESLRNSNSSFIIYQNIKSHMLNCSSCRDDVPVLLNRCSILKPILYPYGLYISDDVKKNFFLHKGINLDNWCLKCKEEEIETKNNLTHKNKINYKSNIFLKENDKLYKRCLKKDGLCKCTTNLFVGPFNEKVVINKDRKKK